MSWRLATQLTFFLLMSLKWLYCILDDLATLMVLFLLGGFVCFWICFGNGFLVTCWAATLHMQRHLFEWQKQFCCAFVVRHMFLVLNTV